MELFSNFSNFELEPLVVGGENAAPNSIPYQVNIQYYGGLRCGGSILNSLFILTAAHCLFNEDHSLLSTPSILVVAGDYNIYKSEATEQYRSVYAFYVHPGYSPISKFRENDIAILKLGRHLKFNSAVQPISFPKRVMNFTGFGKLSGWGQLGFLNKTPSPELQEVMLPLIPEAECQNLIQRFNLFREQLLPPLRKNNICAGMFRKNGCFGDSGGPLVCKEEGGPDILCGVVSTTVHCGYDNPLPSFFTDVSKYGDWIDQIIRYSWPNNPEYHPIVGEGYNEVERSYLSNSPFHFGNIFSNNESFFYPTYSKTKHGKFQKDFFSIISEIFPSYEDFKKGYLTKMYPDLPITLKDLDDFDAWPQIGTYIDDEETFPYIVIQVLWYHDLNKSIAINFWDQLYLAKLRELKLVNQNSGCEEKIRWKNFFQKYGTHYTRRLTFVKLIEMLIPVRENNKVKHMKEMLGSVVSPPPGLIKYSAPMNNENFPYVTEEELKDQQITFIPIMRKPNVTPIYKIIEESANVAENREKKKEFELFATKFKSALILYRKNKFWECGE